MTGRRSGGVPRNGAVNPIKSAVIGGEWASSAVSVDKSVFTGVGGVKLGPMGQISAQVVVELTQHDRLTTTEGLLTLRLAQELDFGEHTGTAIASLATRLMDAKRAALAGVEEEAEPDALDELAARRDAKRSSA